MSEKMKGTQNGLLPQNIKREEIKKRPQNHSLCGRMSEKEHLMFVLSIKFFEMERK